MCFSASASFGASTILATIGIITLKKSKVPSQMPFASIPLLFAIQQFSEGVLWLGLTNPEYTFWLNIALYSFLIFSQVVWPIWIPFSLWRFEKEEISRKILSKLIIIGVIVSGYLAYCLASFPVKAQLANGHISYILNFPVQLTIIIGALYFVTTVISPLISNLKHMNLLGAATLFSCIVTVVFYSENFISVWCFFAAILSAIIYYVIDEYNKAPMKDIRPINSPQNV